MAYHMFHVGTSDERAQDALTLPARRRITTAQACIECRRRKTRCDGKLPCQQCVWYQHPGICTYPKQQRKGVPFRSTVDSLQSRVHSLTTVFSKIFPGQDPEQLATLSQKELLDLVQHLNDSTLASDRNKAFPDLLSNPESEAVDSVDRSSAHEQSYGAARSSADAESLSVLEQAPDRDPAADEAQRYEKRDWTLADDVNALSISVRQKTSYVGVSSISAALEVIFKIEPSVRTWMARNHTETANSSQRNSPEREMLELDGDPSVLPPAHLGERYIDMFFARIHPMMPMIDEYEFRNLYLYTNRRDTPWSMLLNIVFALGSVADPASDKHDHLIFSHRVRSQFSLELFGSGNLFVLQALGLLTGYYLHWLSRPNEANALMGAALRMAVAMGLHREFSSPEKSGTAGIAVETRRRTWWSLVCLDTWAGMSTGRPSLGRLGAAITVKSPQIPEQTNNAQYLASIKLLPLVHSVRFCHLATHIQDKIASQTTLSTSELTILDNELVQWYHDLPPILVHTKPLSSSPSSESQGKTPVPGQQLQNDCPEQLRTPRLIMYWWYMTLRVLAHRPILLSSALRRLSGTAMSDEDRNIVMKCRTLAAQLINDIDQSCPEEIIATWNAVWMAYQAVLVPMVSLALDTSLLRSSGARAAADQDVEAWRQQIHTAIAFFGRKDANISRKCRSMLQRLYDAICNLGNPAHPIAQMATVSIVDERSVKGTRDTQLPEMPILDESVVFSSHMNLDEWLQSYDELYDQQIAWDNVL